MFFYIIKRLLLAGATLFAILFASYAMLRLAPGDPTRSNLFGSDSAGSAVDAEKGGLMRNTALAVPAEPQMISGNRQCAAVKRYIDLHFKETLTLEQLAEDAHMNKYYLSHAFKREYGISPINYMITKRIEESKYLLAETDLSMSQIAQLLGFSSLSYFSQVFRRTQATTPMEYRQSTKNM